MFQSKFVFSQIVEFVPRRILNECIERYHGNRGIKSLDCRDQFLALMFGQLANLRSLRGIVICLNAHEKHLYHLGFKTHKFTLSTLSRANENRNWHMYRDLAWKLIEKARKLYTDDKDFAFEGTAYVLDSTVIELCLATFKWAYFELGKSAVKIHTQMDLRGNIPSFFLITKAKVHDVNFLDVIEFERDSFYIMDRGYFDFERLYEIDRQEAYFVIRAKKTLSFERMYSGKVDKEVGLRLDQTIKLKHFYSRKNYPKKLRRIKYYDKETDRYYVYLTNNFDVDAKTIADLYKRRWQIELFFKWMKQHLKIEVFWGYSFNAVKTQICIAMCTFLTIAIMKKQMKIERNLYEILQILSVSQFEKTPIESLIIQSNLQSPDFESQKQLALDVF